MALLEKCSEMFIHIPKGKGKGTFCPSPSGWTLQSSPVIIINHLSFCFGVAATEYKRERWIYKLTPNQALCAILLQNCRDSYFPVGYNFRTGNRRFNTCILNFECGGWSIYWTHLIYLCVVSTSKLVQLVEWNWHCNQNPMYRSQVEVNISTDFSEFCLSNHDRMTPRSTVEWSEHALGALLFVLITVKFSASID